MKGKGGRGRGIWWFISWWIVHLINLSLSTGFSWISNGKIITIVAQKSMFFSPLSARFALMQQNTNLYANAFPLLMEF